MSEIASPSAVSPALSGRFADDGHESWVRVYYEDTDFSGVVYHANYLRYFERGRSDFLRMAGISHTELAVLPEPLAFAIARVDVRFHRPARIDDLIRIVTQPATVRAASFSLTQRAECGGHLLAEAMVEVVCINLDNRPRRLPKDLAHKVSPEGWPTGATGKNDGSP
ncbi:YbgC/FadM family acyl-CoA thioesterase [Asticcacaulis solisilvae]|uniref:YbgC/FadM family acyl-CoA thioesterase n=1 Tax=Asticcacaulis solisilvae TaxID=1217274 RepID=UPI003FD73126